MIRVSNSSTNSSTSNIKYLVTKYSNSSSNSNSTNTTLKSVEVTKMLWLLPRNEPFSIDFTKYFSIKQKLREINLQVTLHSVKITEFYCHAGHHFFAKIP